MRKKMESGLKARVALEAIRGEKTVAQIASEQGVHPTQIGQWKSILVSRAANLFGKPENTALIRQQELTDNLHRVVGELKVENDWLKKKLNQLV